MVVKQIREGVFETNSSSVHAICINTAEDIDIKNQYPVRFGFDEFGWEHEVWTGNGKADYLWTSINAFFRDDKKEIENIKKKIIDWLLEGGILCEFQEKCDSEFHDHGYVDHPEDLCQFLNWVLSDKQNLYQYLFA